MQQALRFGLSVVTSDGKDVGSLHRVVIDEISRRVTALAVQRPLLTSGNLLKPGGWEKPRDQRVPISALTGTDEDELRVSITEQEFLALPPYVLAERLEPDGEWTPRPGFTAEDIELRLGAVFGNGAYDPPHEEIANRTETERHLSGGTEVWRRQPHTRLGSIHHLLMDDVTTEVTGLAVRRGMIFAHEVVLPFSYVVELFDDLVHVDLTPDQWQRLQDDIVEAGT